MASRPYKRCSISSRIKSRLEKEGVASTTKGDDYVHEETSRAYTFDEEDEDNRVSSNESISCFEDANYANEAGDTEVNYKSRAIPKDVGVASYPQRPATSYGCDDYDLDYGSKKQSSSKSRGYPTELAIQAMHKLQQLKELQRRREYNEKFYDQEIKRLIADTQYLGVKSPTVAKSLERSYHHAGDHHRVNTSLHNKLEPCGTMTTITRLDCGCVEQMTRPIFTTPSGQVRKRSCALEQQVHVRLSAPNEGSRFNHPVAPAGTRLKSRSFNDTGVTATVGNKPDANLILQQKLKSQSAGIRKAPSESSA